MASCKTCENFHISLGLSIHPSVHTPTPRPSEALSLLESQPSFLEALPAPSEDLSALQESHSPTDEQMYGQKFSLMFYRTSSPLGQLPCFDQLEKHLSRVRVSLTITVQMKMGRILMKWGLFLKHITEVTHTNRASTQYLTTLPRKKKYYKGMNNYILHSKQLTRPVTYL